MKEQIVILKIAKIQQHSKFHLDGGGEEPSASRGFFWPTTAFLGGVLLFVPAEEFPEGTRSPN